MRCPDCNKFVSMENGDLEIDVLEIDVDGTVHCEASLPRNCADCGTELKRGTFDVDEDVELDSVECPGAPAEAEDKNHDLSIDELGNDVSESGGSRYAKNMIGFDLEYEVTCSRCELKIRGEIGDAMNAGSFDESV